MCWAGILRYCRRQGIWPRRQSCSQYTDGLPWYRGSMDHPIGWIHNHYHLPLHLVHWLPTVDFVELWSAFYEYCSLLGRSSSRQLMSEHLSEGILWISCLFFELYSFYCVHNSTKSTVGKVAFQWYRWLPTALSIWSLQTCQPSSRAGRPKRFVELSANKVWGTFPTTRQYRKLEYLLTLINSNFSRILHFYMCPLNVNG